MFPLRTFGLTSVPLATRVLVLFCTVTTAWVVLSGMVTGGGKREEISHLEIARFPPINTFKR